MAFINTESLPLKYKYNFNSVNISPFTYKTILTYLEGQPKSESEKLLYDLNWLLMDDGNCGELLLPDAEYLIFLKKAISIDKDLVFKAEVKCPRCGKSTIATIYGRDLEFTRPTDEMVYNGIWMELTTGTYLCKIPTVNKFLNILSHIKAYGTTKHLDLVKSIAMVNEQQINPMQVENSILNATSEDITIIYTVYDLLFKSLLPIDIKCDNVECELHNKGGMSMEINSLIGNVFRSILLSKPVDRNKIYLK